MAKPETMDQEYIGADDFRRDATRPSGLEPSPNMTGAPDGTSGGNTGVVQSASAEIGTTASHQQVGVDAGRDLQGIKGSRGHEQHHH